METFRGCKANEDCKGARSIARPQRAQRTYKDYFAFWDIVRLHRRAEQIETFKVRAHVQDCKGFEEQGETIKGKKI